MPTVLNAFTWALRDLWAPRILAIMLIPPLVALLACAGLAWLLWDDWARWVADWIATSRWLTWVGLIGVTWVFVWASSIAAVALLLLIGLITAVLVTELVAMPVVVPWVGERRFPGLERRKGGTAAGSVLNAAVAIGVFAVLWVVTLPLWFTGLGALVLPPVLSAYLNQRLFRYDALAEHGSAEEMRTVIARAQSRMFTLGLLLALLYYVPFVNLAAPVLSALAFTHFCLAELAQLRSGKGVTIEA